MQLLPNHSRLGYLMADLMLQDSSELFGEDLAEILSNERKNMFDEQKSDSRKRGTLVSPIYIELATVAPVF